MQKAVWLYAHRQQVFGFCSARALLLIFFAFNKDGRGLSICFIFFTARNSVKAVYADYNTAVITSLLAKFKRGLVKNSKGTEFEIFAANTNNDAQERAALAKVWPHALFILCTFHSMQAWKNNLNKALASIPQGDGQQEVHKQLGHFLRAVLHNILVHNKALALYDAENTYCKKQSRQQNDLSKRQARLALKFLDYFYTYILDKAFWMLWSPAGALEASKQLGIKLALVARTNNALESFNGQIKGGYFDFYLS